MTDGKTKDAQLAARDVRDAARALQDAIDAAAALGLEVRMDTMTVQQLGSQDRPLIHVVVSQPM